MQQNFLLGTVAGAAGTVALDATTYGDMAIRGRPSSGTPSTMVGIIADKLGLSLTAKAEANNDQEDAQNRKNGLGALLGYINGVGIGIAYGLLRSQRKAVPLPLAGVGVGLAAMAASDIPIALSGASNPRQWGVSGWLSDSIPHLVYGFVTVAVYETFARQCE